MVTKQSAPARKAAAKKGKSKKPAAKRKESLLPAERRPVGRPTDYKAEYAEQARKLCLLGATDKELADFFEVAESTLNLWKLEHSEFSESIKGGKVIANANVADRLYQRALGYSHEDVHISNFQGAITITPITKHYPPDPTSGIFFLKNREKEKWRDKVDQEHSGPNGGPIALTMDQIAANPKSRIKVK